MIVGLQSELDILEDHQHQDSCQRLYTRAYCSHKHDDQNEQGLSQKENDLPVIILILVASNEEAQFGLVPSHQIFVSLTLRELLDLLQFGNVLRQLEIGENRNTCDPDDDSRERHDEHYYQVATSVALLLKIAD